MARAAAGEPLRRNARDAARRWRWARGSPRASRSPIRGCTGTTRTSARTTARRWACTATCWSSPPTRTTGRRPTARSCSRSTTSCWRTARSRRSAAPRRRYSAMGRFGDVLLVSGEPDLSLTAQLGEVVRFYLTNTANTRVFKVELPGARMKLVGGDSGHVEHEQFVDDVMLAPSERVVVDVLFDQAGELTLEHHTPGAGLSAGRDHRQRGAGRAVAGGAVRGPAHQRRHGGRARARSRRIWRPSPTRRWRSSPRWTWARRKETGRSSTPARCTRRSSSEEPGHCPECGMKLLAVEAPATTYTCPMHPAGRQRGARPLPGLRHEAAAGAARRRGRRRPHEHEGHAHGEHEHAGHDHAAAGGIEWEDDMVEVNRMTTPANMRWKLIDRETGAENAAIDWQFKVGDQVKIRLLNEMAGDHPMHHPFHVHGAGRFLVLARDGVVEPNLVWKDTVLVRTGETVDILLDVTNVGLWMAHCHIAEHHESGMMFSFNVTPADGDAPSNDAERQRPARRHRRRRRPGRPGDRLPARPAGPAVHDPRSGRHAGSGVARRAGTRCGCSPRSATTACRAGRSPATRTPTRAATTSSPTSPTTRATSSCRSSSAAVSAPSARATSGYLVELDDRSYEADQVVIATGPFQIPRVPAIAERLDPDIVQFHSSEYRTPQDVPAGPVLVVGGGNTGFQIAEELARTHEVHLSIGAAADAAAAANPRPRPVPLSRSHRPDGQDRRVADRPTHATPRDADRVKPARRPPPARHRSPRPHRRRVRVARCASATAAGSAPAPSSGRPASSSTTRSCSCPSSTRTAASCTSAASPHRPGCTSSDCRGSTRAARRCWAGSRTTPSTSRSTYRH